MSFQAFVYLFYIFHVSSTSTITLPLDAKLKFWMCNGANWFVQNAFRFNFYICGGGNGKSCSYTWCFHGTNVLLHGCATILLSYICCRRLKMKTESTLITSLIFALHPIHTEAVSMALIFKIKLKLQFNIYIYNKF